jgi:hypothetical protein
MERERDDRGRESYEKKSERFVYKSRIKEALWLYICASIIYNIRVNLLSIKEGSYNSPIYIYSQLVIQVWQLRSPICSLRGSIHYSIQWKGIIKNINNRHGGSIE